MNQQVILFSGGLDSMCAAQLNPKAKLLYVDMDEHYGERQKENLFRLVEDGHVDMARLVFMSVPGLGEYAVKERNHFLPHRNLLLATLAAQHGNEIIFGSTAGDRHPDNDSRFALLTSQVLCHSNPDTLYLIRQPFYNSTKGEMVGAYLAASGTIEALRATTSCYSRHDSYCGRCISCLRRIAAFAANGFDVDEFVAASDLIRERLSNGDWSGSERENAEVCSTLEKYT